MPGLWRRWIAIAAVATCLAASLHSASSQQTGWSTTFDPRKRAFLSYRVEAGGSRTLLLACLRDVDLFTVASEGVAAPTGGRQKETLSLTNGATRYAIAGEVSLDPIAGVPTFAVDFDIDARSERRIKSELMPVLEGKGPLVLTIGSARRELPVAGLAAALTRFKSICFGTR